MSLCCIRLMWRFLKMIVVPVEKALDEKNAVKAQMYDMISKEKEAQPPIPPVQEETSGTENEEENES